MSSRTRFLPRILLVLAATLLLAGLPRSTSASPVVLLTGFPTLRQQHALTCESSAVSMATRGVITETQLMDAMPRAANPNLGFRGNPDGLQGTKLVDYGVYAQPLHLALLKFGYQSDVLSYVSDAIIKAEINRGHPVVAWVTYALQRGTPRLVMHNNVQFFLVPHEHAVLVVGFDRLTVLANDPWTGKMVRYYWPQFNRGWGYFGNMGLAVDPCPMATQVPSVRLVDESSDSLGWTWKKAVNAVQYDVTITRHGNKDTVIYHGVQTNRHLSLSNPAPGLQYEISVVAMSACGDPAPPTTLLVQMPDVLPTPTTTPGPERTPVPSPTSTSTPTPTATPTPNP